MGQLPLLSPTRCYLVKNMRSPLQVMAVNTQVVAPAQLNRQHTRYSTASLKASGEKHHQMQLSLILQSPGP